MPPSSKMKAYSKYTASKTAKKATATSSRRALYRNVPHGLGSLGETKVVDLVSAAYGCDTTGTVTALNLVSAGSSYNNRIGRKTAMKSLYINGLFRPQSTVANDAYCRVIVVYDMQANGVLPAWADIVLSQTQAIATTASTALDNVNLNNRDRFRIILDHRVVLPQYSGAAVATGPVYPTSTEIQFHEFRKLGRIETNYKADSSPAVIGDVATGSLIMFTFGDQAAGASYNLVCTTRVRFEDN